MDGNLLSALLGALLGAAVGGLGTYIAQRTQTTRLIEAGTEQYRLAAQEERQRSAAAAEQERLATRRQLGRTAAYELLEMLAEVHNALPVLRQVNLARFRDRLDGWQAEAADRAGHALELLRRGLMVQAQIVGGDVLQRWDRLTGLAREYASMRGEKQGVDHRDNAVPVPDPRVDRAQQDVDQYLQYVHSTLTAWLADEEPPVEVPDPVLSRADVEVWRWTRPDGSSPSSTVTVV